MADWDFDDFEACDRREPAEGQARTPRLQGLVNTAGAITSAALIVGLGVWAYKLAVRDVSGIPVIEALEGPARVAPENPGGDLASHQGLAVNEIAADGTAGDPADRLTLAPRAAELAAADRPMGTLAGSGATAAAPATPAPVVPAPDFTEAPRTEPLPDGPADPIADPLVAEGATPLPPVDVIAADIPGVARSPRPLARPASLGGRDLMAEAAAAAVAAALAPQEAAAVDVVATALPAGAQLVQIGSYPAAAEARLEWDKTVTRFGALMDGKRRLIEPAKSGGETFYRLRVEGFADLDDARRFCAALKAENSECVPAVVR